jgi:hypothetical protein
VTLYPPSSELIVAALEDSLEFEGYTKGTLIFEKKMRERKVEKCRELKRMAVCSECPVYDECDLIKSHLRDL